MTASKPAAYWSETQTDLILTTVTLLNDQEPWGVSSEPPFFHITTDRTNHKNNSKTHIDIRKINMTLAPTLLSDPHTRWIAEGNNQPLSDSQERAALPRINALLNLAGFRAAEDMEDLAILWGAGVRAVVSSSPDHPPLIFLFWKNRQGVSFVAWEKEGDIIERGEWLGKP